jgi:hypothetical protein
MLLDVINGERHQAAQILQSRPGVVTVALVEGLPQLVFVVEATERQTMAKLTVSALASVESVTTGVRLLPIQDGHKHSD